MGEPQSPTWMISQGSVSYDEIAERRGRLLSPNDIHVASHGAKVIADRVEGFLRQDQPSTA